MWKKAIEQYVKNCETIVVIGSKDAFESQWVGEEITIAKLFYKPLYIFQTEKFQLSQDMAFKFSAIDSFFSADDLIRVLSTNSIYNGHGWNCDASMDIAMPDGAANMSWSDYDAPVMWGESYEATEKPCLPMETPVLKKEGKKYRVKPSRINKVDFSILSPMSVKPDSLAVIDVYMYTKKQRRIIDEAIKAAKDKIIESARTSSSLSVRQGSKITVVLASDNATIYDEAETLIWNGEALNFKFCFTLPKDYKKRQVNFSCNILFDGIHISRLYFSVKVNCTKVVPIKFVRKDCKEAFVSYSHLDKQRVVEQLYAIQTVAPKMKFWMDTQSMTAGDVWRSSIASAIESSDIFLLFWSVNSSTSSEVRKEWEYALQLEKTKKKKRNGARFISPVPLDSPKRCLPPPELSDLHFGDPSFEMDLEYIDEINFVGSKKKNKNIRVIK